MDKILLKIPKKSEYMSTIRLTSSALSNINRFNIDEIEDIKVIVSEICTFFIKNLNRNTEDFEISYQVSQNKIIVTVADLNDGELSVESLNDDMSIMIIESLSDNFNYDFNNKTITFEKTKIGVD
ncbi:MAG: ATP-binding protein [Tissierellia bacterium]|jgi:serine/threonine-protein kinase RsbW|nr:ATP-binding protein [Tissierellia bacterium]MDD3225993.1 ATP-binding protein [Tissierellia bacterium]MDD3751160.1 ATP-binding protein [Tissierellia bacterium]MDD4046414.1 ATP-binding protein [Tissierellia bacterium]MDD4677849.1 ATP-binding protein [Tissierellia bacterium]